MNEREKYQRMWAIDEYRMHSPEEHNLQNFVTYLGVAVNSKVNIYGCGPGRAGRTLARAGYEVHMLDIADNCLDEAVAQSLHDLTMPLYFHLGRLAEATDLMPEADWGYCCDVLEHIPPVEVDFSLRAIAELTPRAYLTVSHVADGFGKRIGEPLHLTVQPLDWWLVLIRDAWEKAGHRVTGMTVTESGSQSTIVISEVLDG